MSTPSVSEGRTCPECGKRNSGLSLFCSECGTPLMDDAVWARPTDGTQTTSAFSPAQDPDATSAFTPQQATQHAPQAATRDLPTTRDGPWESPGSATPASSIWAAPAASTLPDSPAVIYEPPESRRGFILGVIASMLIALVIGFVIWASLLDASTRDTIAGWFT